MAMLGTNAGSSSNGSNPNSSSSNSSNPHPHPSEAAPPAIDDIEDFHALHDQAMREAETTYIDPATGFMVFSELTHLKRGKCCGNRCRHCPYGFEKVRQPRGSWRRRRAAGGLSGGAAAEPSAQQAAAGPTTIPGAPPKKLRSGDQERAQAMVREILERAGKWNPEDDCRKIRTTNQTTNDDASSTSESLSDSSCSSSESESLSCSSESCSSLENATSSTPRATAAAPPTTIAVTVIGADKDTATINSSTTTSASSPSLSGSITSKSGGSTTNNNNNNDRQTTPPPRPTTTITTKNVPYTRSGDRGTSQLSTGERRSKTDDAFEAMGSVDELCSFVGVAHSHLLNNTTTNKAASLRSKSKKSALVCYEELPVRLLDVMSRLFDVGSHIAKPQPATTTTTNNTNNNSDPVFVPNGIGDGFDADHVDDLEDWINEMTEDLPELTSFILPTGAPASAALHVARTVCRRAERRVVPLVTSGICDPNALRYLNRLSDFFFVSARWVNFKEGQGEIEYRLDLCDDDEDDQRERVHRSLTTPATTTTKTTR